MKGKARMSYSQGQKDGIWTIQQVRQCGFKTAKECLDHQEREYEKEMAATWTLPKSNRDPNFPQKQRDYLKGMILTTRESLQALIERGL